MNIQRRLENAIEEQFHSIRQQNEAKRTHFMVCTVYSYNVHNYNAASILISREIPIEIYSIDSLIGKNESKNYS